MPLNRSYAFKKCIGTFDKNECFHHRQGDKRTQMNTQQNEEQESFSAARLLAGFFGVLLLIMIITVVICLKAEETKKYPYQRQIESLWNDKTLSVQSGSPRIRKKPYTIYYRNNDGKWIYMREANRVVDPDTGEYHLLHPDYPDAVEDVKGAQTVVLLWLDASTSERVKGFKWTDGSIAYDAPLKMTVIDPSAHFRYQPVDFARVLVNHKRDGLYSNKPCDSTDGGMLNAYPRLTKYFR